MAKKSLKRFLSLGPSSPSPGTLRFPLVDNCKDGKIIGVPRNSPGERPGLVPLSYTTRAHIRAGKKDVEEGRPSVNAHTSPPLSLLFHGQRYVTSSPLLSTRISSHAVGNIG